MAITRREFIEGGLGAVTVLGVSLLETTGLGRLAAAAGQRTIAEIPVAWLATGSCSGCSVALLNSGSPTVQELLLAQLLPGQHLSLAFHTTIMAAAGDQATQALNQVRDEHEGKFVLVVDGATATKDEGLYCCTGEENGQPITGYDQLLDLGSRAMAVLAIGACASFGGIPAAGVNPTACVSVGQLFERENIATPYVNIPGCPPHPDWIVGTIATLLLGGVEALDLDEHHRPAPFFQQCIHDNCAYRGHFERGIFAEHFGEHGCLLKLGCKGPITFADCPIRKFNNGTNWCCEAGHPCIGCCHPEFPFEQSLFLPVEPAQLDYPNLYTAAQQERRPNKDTYVAVGLIGAGGFLAGAGAVTAAKMLQRQKAGAAAVSPPDSPKEA